MRLRTETLDDGTEMVLEPYFGYGVYIPAGFIFDGASTGSSDSSKHSRW